MNQWMGRKNINFISYSLTLVEIHIRVECFKHTIQAIHEWCIRINKANTYCWPATCIQYRWQHKKQFSHHLQKVWRLPSFSRCTHIALNKQRKKRRKARNSITPIIICFDNSFDAKNVHCYGVTQALFVIVLVHNSSHSLSHLRVKWYQDLRRSLSSKVRSVDSW